MRHDGLVLLLREQPGLIPELLRSALGFEVPRDGVLRVEDASFPQLVPTEYRADLVLTLTGHEGRPELGVIVEVQLRRDQEKRFSWPLYAAALHARLRCAIVLLVIAPRARVAEWAREPITTLQRGSPFVPLVLGPEEIP